MTASWTIEQIAEAFTVNGHRAYSGEPVTQMEHALQAAWLAQQDSASDAQITAALLHDVGHLVAGLGGSPSLRGIDDRHQVAALIPLSGFPKAVLEPIRLHVDAKRFLCRSDYLDALSPDSLRSLVLQGGPFEDDAANAFAREPFSAQAIALRLWDDRAKVKDMVTPDLVHFLKVAARVLHPASNPA